MAPTGEMLDSDGVDLLPAQSRGKLPSMVQTREAYVRHQMHTFRTARRARHAATTAAAVSGVRTLAQGASGVARTSTAAPIQVAVGPPVPMGDLGLNPEQRGPDEIAEPLAQDGYASVVLPEVHDMEGNCSDRMQPSEVRSFLIRGCQSAESSGIQPGGMPLAHFDAADVSASSQGPASPGTGAHGPPVAGCGGASAQGPSGGGVPCASVLQADPFSRYAAYLRGRRTAALCRHFWLWRAAPCLGDASLYPPAL